MSRNICLTEVYWRNIDFKVFWSHSGFKKYFLFIFWSENGNCCGNHQKFWSAYYKTFILVWFLSSQFTVNQLDSTIVFLGQMLQFQSPFFEKKTPWGLNIVVKIDLVKSVLSDTKGFTNVYCDQHISPWFERCVGNSVNWFCESWEFIFDATQNYVHFSQSNSFL